MDLDRSMERKINEMQETYMQKMQNELTKLDREFLRKMQAAYFRCGVKCCEDSESSVSDVQSCIERCEVPLTQAHNLMQSEMSSFQSRINQCSVECADRARDKMVQDPTEEQIQTAKRQVLDCAKNCVENQLTTGLPALVSRLAHQLKKLKSDQLKLAP
ncbi:hypothetical protein AHF37_07692 [Paragonimus kellicotti]|nr:hypothetical protein AHF37_07692 [Paragonimus kellicotti]